MEALRNLMNDVDGLQRRLDDALRRLQDMPSQEVLEFLREQTGALDAWFEEARTTWEDALASLDGSKNAQDKIYRRSPRNDGVNAHPSPEDAITSGQHPIPARSGLLEGDENRRGQGSLSDSPVRKSKSNSQDDEYSPLTYGTRLYSIEKRMAAMGGVPALGKASLPALTPEQAQKARISLKSVSKGESERHQQVANENKLPNAVENEGHEEFHPQEIKLRMCGMGESDRDGKVNVSLTGSAVKATRPGAVPQESELAAVLKRKGLGYAAGSTEV